jgi:hypothetical protein
MSNSDEPTPEDIAGLFRKFGGDAHGYKEFAPPDNEAEPPRAWPLLSGAKISHAPVPAAAPVQAAPAPAPSPPAPVPVPPPVPAPHRSSPLLQPRCSRRRSQHRWRCPLCASNPCCALRSWPLFSPPSPRPSRQQPVRPRGRCCRR